MKFSIEKSTLLRSLQYVNKATPTRSTLPILSCVLFEVRENNLMIRTTSLEVYISLTVNIEESENGKIAVPLHTLLDITNAMPEEFLHFQISDIGKVNITSTCGKYTIMGQSADEFPAEPVVEKGNSLTLLSSELNSIINQTIYATSKDELKPVLQGVLINMNSNGLTSVATDGHRLVKYIKNNLTSSSFDGKVIVPVKFLSLIKPLLSEEGKISLQIGENYVMVEINGIKISSRIIKDRYPDYDSVIPKNNENELKVDRNILLASVKRVAIFSNRSTKQIALSLSENKVLISTEDPENITTGKETVDCEYSGEPMVIGYNAQYLGDVLKNQSTDRIKIMLNSPLNAAIFLPEENKDDESITTLLMPIRLND